MTEAQHVELLRIIFRLALLGYPHPVNASQVDERLVLALGQIGGIASKALHDTGQPTLAPGAASGQ